METSFGGDNPFADAHDDEEVRPAPARVPETDARSPRPLAPPPPRDLVASTDIPIHAALTTIPTVLPDPSNQTHRSTLSVDRDLADSMNRWTSRTILSAPPRASRSLAPAAVDPPAALAPVTDLGPPARPPNGAGATSRASGAARPAPGPRSSSGSSSGSGPVPAPAPAPALGPRSTPAPVPAPAPFQPLFRLRLRPRADGQFRDGDELRRPPRAAASYADSMMYSPAPPVSSASISAGRSRANSPSYRAPDGMMTTVALSAAGPAAAGVPPPRESSEWLPRTASGRRAEGGPDGNLLVTVSDPQISAGAGSTLGNAW